MPNVLRHIEAQALAAWRFVTLDMWRLTRASLAAPTRLGVATLRVLYMTVQAYIEESIGSLAGSLTYSTVLSLVPILAVIIGIAKGFGLQETVRYALMRALPGHEVEFGKAFAYVENYLSQVQGGLFIGVDLMHLDELQLQRQEEKEHPEDATRYKSPHQIGEEFAYPVEEEDEEYLDKCLHKQS